MAQATSTDLEKLYSPSRWSNRFTDCDEVIRQHVIFITKRSQESMSGIPCRLNVPYGQSGNEKIDIFGEDLPKDAPVFVFIHGGYWQELGREVSSYFVKPFYDAGCVVVVVGYDLCPKEKMESIVAEVNSALLYTVSLATDRGSRGVYICGHSAGAHLAAMFMSSVHAPSSNTDSVSLIKGYILSSGVFDLRPLLETYVNKALSLNKERAEKLSPLLLPHSKHDQGCEYNVLVVSAEYDSPAFIKQSIQYNQLLVEADIDSKHELITEVDHFSLMERLYEPDYQLTKMILSVIQ